MQSVKQVNTNKFFEPTVQNNHFLVTFIKNCDSSLLSLDCSCAQQQCSWTAAQLHYLIPSSTVLVSSYSAAALQLLCDRSSKHHVRATNPKP
jgi:hypothetical protein